MSAARSSRSGEDGSTARLAARTTASSVRSCARIAEEPTLGLDLMVTGMHLSPAFGLTVRGIKRTATRSATGSTACLLAADRRRRLPTPQD